MNAHAFLAGNGKRESWPNVQCGSFHADTLRKVQKGPFIPTKGLQHNAHSHTIGVVPVHLPASVVLLGQGWPNRKGLLEVLKIVYK